MVAPRNKSINNSKKNNIPKLCPNKLLRAYAGFCCLPPPGTRQPQPSVRFRFLKSHFTFAFRRPLTTLRMLPMVALHLSQMLLRLPLRYSSGSSSCFRLPLTCSSSSSSSSRSSASVNRLLLALSDGGSCSVSSLVFLGLAKLLSEGEVQLSSSPFNFLVNGGRIGGIGVKLRTAQSCNGSTIRGGSTAGRDATVPRSCCCCCCWLLVWKYLSRLEQLLLLLVAGALLAVNELLEL